MKIVHREQVPEQIRVQNHRQGTFRYWRLMEGEPRTPGNFLLEMVHTTSDFFSPRHKHNFDQFRYQVEGEFDFDRNGLMTPGMIGYFPEGTPYGPQTSSQASLTVVLQFGGASLNGYMTNKELEEGAKELAAFGTFEKGVFRRKGDAEGKRNIDGYQAVWEHVNKRPMVYPEPRYNDPLLMNPAHFAWLPVEGVDGLYEKLMGVFTERRTSARFLKLEPRARFTARGRSLHIVLRGSGTLGSDAYRPYTTLYTLHGDEAEFTAGEASEILELGLPRVNEAQRSLAAAE